MPSNDNTCYAALWKIREQLRQVMDCSISQTSTPTSTLPPGGVGGNGGHVFNSTDFEARTRKCTESRLGTRTRGFGTVTTCCPELDVKRCDTELL